MTLRRKLLLSLLCSLLPLLALGIGAHVVARRALLDDAGSRVTQVAELRATELSGRLAVAGDELRAIAAWPDLARPAIAVAAGTASRDVLVDPLAAVATWWAGFEVLSVVDDGGAVLASVGAGRVPAPLDLPPGSFATPVRVGDRWITALAAPLGPGVTLVAELDTAFLAPGGIAPVDAVLGDRGVGAVVAPSEGGRVVVFVPTGTDVAAASTLAREVAATGRADGGRLVDVADAGADVVVAASASRDDVLRPLSHIRWLTAAAAGIAAVVAVVAAWVLGRALTARIARLRDTTTAIGEGDFARRAGDDSGDEIGELAASLDRMAAQLATDNERRTQIQDELSHQALHDPLTGLANRVKFIDRLGDALARSRRSGAPVAVLFCDLDNLKTVNDRLGHAIGDDLLTGVADRFRSSVRPSDTVARFGGDEFVVLCSEMAAPEDALVVADRLAAALEQPFVLEGEEISTSASIGIAVGSGATASVEDLVRDADAAMYDAKAHGKAKWVVHATSLGERAERRRERADEVRAALDSGQLRLEYQPVLELADGRLHHVEALVRWDHPDRGVIGPHLLLAQAADAGYATELDGWVLDAAVAQSVSWDDVIEGDRPVRVSVNVSRESVRTDRLGELVAAALARHGAAPERLIVEISEPVLADDPGAAVATVDRLHDLGVAVVVDDFGTGHTSVERLRRHRFDLMKIDGSLLELRARPDDHAALIAALSLASALGMTAVAEGVEELRQVQELLHLGCRLAQGHLFCAPVGERGLGPWLARMEL